MADETNPNESMQILIALINCGQITTAEGRSIDDLHTLVNQIDKALQVASEKAAKWDALDDEIGQFYEECSEGCLDGIGEVAAMAFGYL